jgi:glutathione S-transferase
MKLLYSPASPFVAKVRLAARHIGISLNCIAVDAMSDQTELLSSNPLGKIPCLVLDSGQGVYDSKVIMRELDRQSGGKLFPTNHDALLAAEQLESIADGMSDCAVAGMYELRLRPEEKVHQPWIDRQWDKVTRGLDYLNSNCPSLDGELTAGHFALAAMLGYLDLRYEGKWQDGHENLVQWQSDFGSTVAAYDELKPSA